MEENKPLKELSTFGIGGLARFFLKAHTLPELKEGLLFAQEKGVPWLVIGKGSNCLFSDEGFEGVVIQNKIDFFNMLEPGLFHAGAGYSFALLGTKTAQQGYSGLEFASGIPATVGGAIFMNAGANGSETADSLDSIEFLDETGKIEHLSRKDLNFSYRTSPFQNRKGIILSAIFRLKRSLTARQKQLEIFSQRKKTQPYGDKSAGCVFRNPNCLHAGKLIEDAGLKGVRVGGAEISTLHANFIVNKEGATQEDVLNLITQVKEKVYAQHQVHLESEIRIIPPK